MHAAASTIFLTHGFTALTISHMYNNYVIASHHTFDIALHKNIYIPPIKECFIGTPKGWKCGKVMFITLRVNCYHFSVSASVLQDCKCSSHGICMRTSVQYIRG